MFLLHYIRNWFLDFFRSNLNKQSLIMFTFCRFTKGWMSFGRKKALETCSTFVWMIALICLWNYSQTISFSRRVYVPIGDWFQHFVCIWLTSVELGFKKPLGPFLSRACSLVDMQMSIKRNDNNSKLSHYNEKNYLLYASCTWYASIMFLFRENFTTFHADIYWFCMVMIE